MVAATVVIVLDTIRAVCRTAQMWGQILPKVVCREVVLGVVRLDLPLRNVGADLSADERKLLKINELQSFGG